MPRRNAAFLVGVNASSRYSKWPVVSCPLMAGRSQPVDATYWSGSRLTLGGVQMSRRRGDHGSDHDFGFIQDLTVPFPWTNANERRSPRRSSSRRTVSIVAI